ncbi:MAG: hypothetical protein M5U28_26265 [Sandaracinaceae bacterium]|nr:hypothetical protein [Sandaracinaceae bacterium]
MPVPVLSLVLLLVLVLSLVLVLVLVLLLLLVLVLCVRRRAAACRTSGGMGCPRRAVCVRHRALRRRNERRFLRRRARRVSAATSLSRAPHPASCGW